MRILIIEDDTTIAANLYDYLEGRGHSVDAAADGAGGLHLATTQTFDAIVLDLGLPGMDGLSVTRKLRDDAHLETPILMLTARDTLDDKLRGFAQGADDYLVKPFSLKEVEARLQALYKRSSGRTSSRVIEAGTLKFDPKSRVALRTAAWPGSYRSRRPFRFPCAVVRPGVLDSHGGHLCIVDAAGKKTVFATIG